MGLGRCRSNRKSKIKNRKWRLAPRRGPGKMIIVQENICSDNAYAFGFAWKETSGT
jgi:hypothetical protein